MSDVGPLVKGAIKWYNKEKGYGFIQVAGGSPDVFVHANQLRKSGIENGLNEGDKVTFGIEKHDGNNGKDLKKKGLPYAVNIKKM